ncbi:GTPase IMAP family member 9-like [Engraulis encrasicolus]|uniref:GTPase IMAP family member 9-like n=1 Tax=Engraulis encrasicolus TaxID=184585 RepID=UPI002FD2A99A
MPFYALDETRCEPEEIRIVVIGQSGSGKSATRNKILGRRAFESKPSTTPVTLTCRKERGECDGTTVVVVDTPGHLYTKKTEVLKCISLCVPGPHAILVVIQLNRVTEAEKHLSIIQKMFGKGALHYAIALFTCGDNLKEDGGAIEDFICQSQDLHAISQCGGGHHVFNNRDKDPSEVKELLEKVNKLVQKNGGTHFTNEKFTKADRALKAEIDRLRFNTVERHLKNLQWLFGEEASRYTIVLFTRGDELPDGVTTEELISQNPFPYGVGYHIFNNRDEDPTQVRELLKKIKRMAQKNGGEYCIKVKDWKQKYLV